MQKLRTALTVSKGFSGLIAAIECYRQGHDVSIYESFKELKVLGDIISFSSNARRIFRRWHYKSRDRVSNRLRPLSIDLRNYSFNIYNLKADLEALVFNGHRGKLHTIVFEYVHADVMIRSDGVRLKARELVLGYDDRLKASGYRTRGLVSSTSIAIRSKARSDLMCTSSSRPLRAVKTAARS
ncbi:hypothetical protein D6C78_11036 [Aureobasidium pullulans]|uniref:Uncharacterized protein n=1 Tax=Aureobasidium pullulans TaxID=5580 RepID=A0A4T0B415_AURPU|nr:hypothetical protein D6C78_11036 [Aureobasidium pullulans]